MANEVYVQGYDGYVGIGLKQSAIGTSIAADKFLQVNPDISLVEIEDGKEVLNTIRFGRSMYSYKRGLKRVEGSMSGPLYPDNEWMFGLLMGDKNTVAGDAATGFTHTFNEEDSTNLFSQNGSTVEVHLGTNDNVALKDFAGCFLSKLTLNMPADDIVTWAMDLVGVSMATAGVISAPTYTTENPYEGFHVDLQLGSAIGSTATTEAKDIVWSMDNQIKMLPKLNSQAPVGRVLGNRIVECSFTSNLKDFTLQNLYKNNTTQAAKIIITHTALAGSSSGFFTITINMPNIVFLGDEANLNNSQEIDQPIRFQAIHDATAGYQIQITAKNSETGVYDIA